MQRPCGRRKYKALTEQNEAVQLAPRAKRTMVQGKVMEATGVVVPLKKVIPDKIQER